MNSEDFEGLKALLEFAFPKTCKNCGHVYKTAEQFFAETLDMPSGRSSLKMTIEDDGAPIVEAFRNCRCGSTLMDEFGCRRDTSESGVQRRITFDRMLSLLLARNIPEAVARAELANFLRGKPNRLQAWLDDDNVT